MIFCSLQRFRFRISLRPSNTLRLRSEFLCTGVRAVGRGRELVNPDKRSRVCNKHLLSVDRQTSQCQSGRCRTFDRSPSKNNCGVSEPARCRLAALPAHSSFFANVPAPLETLARSRLASVRRPAHPAVARRNLCELCPSLSDRQAGWQVQALNKY